MHVLADCNYTVVFTMFNFNRLAQTSTGQL